MFYFSLETTLVKYKFSSNHYPPISCLSMPSSQCSLAVEMLMVSVGLLLTTVMEALDRRSSVTWTTICQHTCTVCSNAHYLLFILLYLVYFPLICLMYFRFNYQPRHDSRVCQV